jgi:hypothetical protein
MVVCVVTSALGSRSATFSSDNDDTIERKLDAGGDEKSFAGVPVDKRQQAELRSTLVSLTKKLDDVYNLLVTAAEVYRRVQSGLKDFGQNTGVLAAVVSDQLAELATILAAQTAETLLAQQRAVY